MTPRCTRFHPGHHVHWIQARASRQPGEEVTLRDAGDGHLVVSRADGTEHTWWHHDPAAVTRAGAIGHARLCEPGPLLRVPVADGAELLLYPSLPPEPDPSGPTAPATACHVSTTSR